MILQTLDVMLSFSAIMLLLSLMVTVIVQMAVSVVGLRGTNLAWGVRKLLGTIASDLSGDEVKALSRAVLHHPSLAVTKDTMSFLFWKHGGARPPVEVTAQDLLLVLDRLRKSGGMGPGIQKSLESLFTEGAGDSSKLAQSLQLLQSLEKVAPDQAQALRETAERNLGEAKRIVAELHDWYDGAMARVSERFTLHARWWTGGIALILAFSLGVDSVLILKQLWANPKVASQIAAQSQTALDLYQEVEATRSEGAAVSVAVDTAADQAASAESRAPDEPTDPTAAETKQAADAATAAAAQAMAQQQALDARIQRLGELHDEVKSGMLGLDLTVFINLGEGATAEAGEGAESEPAAGVQASGEDDGFFPSTGSRWLGQLMTVLLLSLGGPFWYGLIGKLVGFRSLVAGGKKQTE